MGQPRKRGKIYFASTNNTIYDLTLMFIIVDFAAGIFQRAWSLYYLFTKRFIQPLDQTTETV
ncbi:MAG: hypothetical protein GF308_18540 [Candidatus Heimdallarchaeota archaeon]|nr:hypothetical protein [Candidatus Heimdallarchaeota archaeon]